MTDFEIKLREMCEWIWDGDKEICYVQRIFDKIMEKLHPLLLTEEMASGLKRNITVNFISKFSEKWRACYRDKKKFIEKYQQWMENTFTVNIETLENTATRGRSAVRGHSARRGLSRNDSNSSRDESSSSRSRSRSIGGRPKVSYEDSSERSKRRKNQQLRSFVSQKQLEEAILSVKKKEIKTTCDERTIRNSALALYMDLDLSKDKYIELRKYNKRTNTSNKYYPAYEEIVRAKKECYPDNIEITEHGAKVKLQALMDHTVRRLIYSFDNEQLGKLDNKNIILISKWGMDGSSGQQTFKQIFSGRTTSERSSEATTSHGHHLQDSSVFMISVTPVQLRCETTQDTLWGNKYSSSTRYCRPIKFEFKKETSENTSTEHKFYMDEIQKLVPTSISEKGIKCTVTHDLHCTMIDGKSCNALTGQKSSASCNICNVTPKNINNLSYVKSLQSNESFYQFGLSTLHSWIRFMECILHISYNLEFKKGCAKGDDKHLKEAKKKSVQEGLRQELGILVDMVKQGYGSTNDGNTSRRFFKNVDIVSKITGVSEKLIGRFAIILQVMASGRKIDTTKFEEYCHKTAEMFVQLYPWYKMPPSVHKVLIHGANIIKAAPVPIGQLSEESAEAANKVFRKSRAYRSRTCNRKASNEDVFHFLMVSSDPLISSLRRIKKKKVHDLLLEARSLISESDTEDGNDGEDSENEDDDSENDHNYNNYSTNDYTCNDLTDEDSYSDSE